MILGHKRILGYTLENILLGQSAKTGMKKAICIFSELKLLFQRKK